MSDKTDIDLHELSDELKRWLVSALKRDVANMRVAADDQRLNLSSLITCQVAQIKAQAHARGELSPPVHVPEGQVTPDILALERKEQALRALLRLAEAAVDGRVTIADDDVALLN